MTKNNINIENKKLKNLITKAGIYSTSANFTQNILEILPEKETEIKTNVDWFNKFQWLVPSLMIITGIVYLILFTNINLPQFQKPSISINILHWFNSVYKSIDSIIHFIFANKIIISCVLSSIIIYIFDLIIQTIYTQKT